MVYKAYNLTGMGNSTGMIDLMQTVNSELMFGFFGIGVLLSIFVISFLSFNAATGGSASRSFAAASFIIFGLSVLMFILDLIPNYAVWVTLILASFSIVFIKNS